MSMLGLHSRALCYEPAQPAVVPRQNVPGILRVVVSSAKHEAPPSLGCSLKSEVCHRAPYQHDEDEKDKQGNI